MMARLCQFHVYMQMLQPALIITAIYSHHTLQKLLCFHLIYRCDKFVQLFCYCCIAYSLRQIQFCSLHNILFTCMLKLENKEIWLIFQEQVFVTHVESPVMFWAQVKYIVQCSQGNTNVLHMYLSRIISIHNH